MNRDFGLYLLLGTAHSLNHSIFLVLPPLLANITRDLNTSLQYVGLIVTISFLIYGAGAIIGGPLSDYLGVIKIARLSIGLAGASTLVFLLQKSLPTFGLGMILMAFWASFYHPISNSLIYRIFDGNPAGAMGIHGAAGSIGQIFTPTMAYLIGTWIDWRFAFIFFGSLSILTAFAMGKIREQESSVEREKIQIMKVLKIQNLWILLLYLLFVGLFFKGVELFLPTFLSNISGFSGQLAAISNSLVILFAVVGQYFGGRAADRFGSDRVLLVSTIGLLVSILFLLLLRNVFGVILFIVIYGLAEARGPAITSLLGHVSPKNLLGTTFGVMFLFVFGLGSISTTIVGYLAELFNLEVAFWFLATFSVMAIIVSLIIKKNF